MTAANLTGTWDASSTLKFSGNLYVRSFERRTVDGNVAEFEGCSDPANVNFLCLESGNFPPGTPEAQLIIRDPQGNPVPIAALGGGLSGSIDRTHTRSLAWGGALQATHEDKLGAFNNRLVMGLNLDFSRVDFSANSELGVIGPDLTVSGLGITYHTLVNGGVSEVGLGVRNTYAGVYALDTLDVTDRWSMTAGGRVNYARVALTDKQIGRAHV